MHFLNDAKRKVTEFAEENSAFLLTVGGVVGTTATAVLTGRAGFKAATIIRDKELAHVQPEGVVGVIDGGENATMGLSKTQKVLLVWPHFVPPVLTGSVTIASIIMAHKMSAQKAAALIAAYGFVQKDFEEYKEKVSEKLTGPKQTQVDDELAQERVDKTPGHQNIVIVEGEVLCFDEPTARYFRSTMQNIEKAVNAINAEIIHHDHANASFFYEELGLPATSWTDEVGWNTDRLLKLKYSTVLSPDGRPCIAIDFQVLPTPDYIPKHY
ncbi:MAG: DUF6353 family protein [Ktedonobacteraceae bacterium]